MTMLKKLTGITIVVAALALAGYVGVTTAAGSGSSTALPVANQGAFQTSNGSSADLLVSTSPTSTITPTLLVEFTGIVESIGPSSWQIGGKTVMVDSNTQIGTGLAVGNEVNVQAVAQVDGTWLAHKIELRIRMTEFFGQVQAMDAMTWTVSGKTFNVNADTEIEGQIMLGNYVHVSALTQNDGALLAKTITLAERQTQFTGVVESIGSDSWTINGTTVGISSTTKIDGTIVGGDQVRVLALVQSDGSLLALRIQPDQQKVTFQGVVESMGASAWMISGKTVTVNSNTQIDPNIQVGNQVKVDATRMADGSLVANQISLISQHIKLVGRVESMSPTEWMVGGQAIVVNGDTQIGDHIQMGSLVLVHAVTQADGSFLATQIELAKPQITGKQNGDDQGTRADLNNHGEQAGQNENKLDMFPLPVRIPPGLQIKNHQGHGAR